MLPVPLTHLRPPATPQRNRAFPSPSLTLLHSSILFLPHQCWILLFLPLSLSPYATYFISLISPSHSHKRDKI